MGGGWKLYVVKRDLSRKAEATRGCQCGRATSTGRRTLHDARFVDGELQPLVTQQYVCFGREGDAAKKYEQLAGGAGYSCEDGWLVLHGG